MECQINQTMELKTKVVGRKGNEIEYREGPAMNIQFSDSTQSLLNRVEAFQELRSCKIRYDKIINFKAKIVKEEEEKERGRNMGDEHKPRMRRVTD